ncbi:MAG: GntR family transcriptional regulator, partial [Pseudohongiellaceae bacterium]
MLPLHEDFAQPLSGWAFFSRASKKYKDVYFQPSVHASHYSWSMREDFLHQRIFITLDRALIILHISHMPNNTPLTDQALAFLRDSIQSGKLSPGQEIDYNQLASELGMSRTPIRESIRQLITEGLVEVSRGGTQRITELTAEQAEGFYQVRDELELAAARAAAVHISDLEIEMLKANLQRFESSKRDKELLVKLDNQFHNLIYDACNNVYLTQTLK